LHIGLARPAFKRPDEPVGKDDMRRKRVPQPTLAGCFRFRRDTEPGYACRRLMPCKNAASVMQCARRM